MIVKYTLFVVFSLYQVMSKITEKIDLVGGFIGTSHQIQIHKYGPQIYTSKVYIQASLHADEIPGLLVSHHLLHLLDQADKKGLIKQQIVLVPFANPIGLSQFIYGIHQGRFSLDSGVNFNRNWPEITESIIDKIKDKLSLTDSTINISIIRAALIDHINNNPSVKLEDKMKQTLYKIACDADIVLDLHCDSDAILHIYTHDKLWPQLSDLAAFLGSYCHLTASVSGGTPFDECMSCPWALISEKLPEYNIPMACQSTTVELRGTYDVTDEYASSDALNIFHFLQSRGYISLDENEKLTPIPPLHRDATPLTAVDMIESPKSGVVVWKIKKGDIVEENQILGEIVDIEDPYSPRTPVITKTSGIVFSLSHYRLVTAGDKIVKVAGEKPLDYRKGNLLTAK